VDAPYVRVNSAGKAWAPKNFDAKFHGPMPIRQALERSINIVSIKLVEQLGVPYVRSFLERCGIQSDPQQGLTIALGTPDVTVIEMCAAYSTFANGGKHFSPILVTDINDRDGHTRYDYTEFAKVGEAMPADVAYVVNHMLQGVATPFPGGGYSPTGARTAAINRPRGGKTGTTNDSRDAWFAGFTPEFTCVVWIGYTDNRPLGEGRDRDGLTFTGGHQAAPVWIDFIKAAEDGLPVKDFEVPDNIEFFNIDRASGTLGGSYKEAYIKGNGPASPSRSEAPEAVETVVATEEATPLESL
jgi:penicillin-binding protein 1A